MIEFTIPKNEKSPKRTKERRMKKPTLRRQMFVTLLITNKWFEISLEFGVV